MKCFLQGAKQHLQKLLFCVETSTSLCSLQKIEGTPGEFKRALSSRLQLIIGNICTVKFIFYDKNYDFMILGMYGLLKCNTTQHYNIYSEITDRGVL